MEKQELKVGDTVKVLPSIKDFDWTEDYQNTYLHDMEDAIGSIYVVKEIEECGVYLEIGKHLDYGYPPQGLELVRRAPSTPLETNSEKYEKAKVKPNLSVFESKYPNEYALWVQGYQLQVRNTNGNWLDCSNFIPGKFFETAEYRIKPKGTSEKEAKIKEQEAKILALRTEAEALQTQLIKMKADL